MEFKDLVDIYEKKKQKFQMIKYKGVKILQLYKKNSIIKNRGIRGAQ